MVKDCLPGAVHQHPPDPLHLGSSEGRVLHFSPVTNFAMNLDLFSFFMKRSVFKFGQNLDFLSYAIHCWPPLLSMDGFEPARSNPFNLRTHNSLFNFLWIYLNIGIHEHQFHWPGWHLPFSGGWTWKGSLRGRLSSPNSWKCSPANPESLPAQIFSFSPPAHLRRPPAGQGISLMAKIDILKTKLTDLHLP